MNRFMDAPGSAAKLPLLAAILTAILSRCGISGSRSARPRSRLPATVLSRAQGRNT
jgi:hypothetical protein